MERSRRIECIFGNKYNLNELAVNWKWAIQGYLTRRLPISLSPSLSFLLSPPSFFTVLPFIHSFIFTRSRSLSPSFLLFYLVAVRALFVMSSSHYLFLLWQKEKERLWQSSLISVLLRNVDLNDIFGRKFRNNREKHFTLSSFLLWVLLSLFARIWTLLPFFIGFFVNNCDARRT